MNKKLKKQVEVEKKRIAHLQLLLNAARQQPDEPQEISRLQKEISECQARINKANADES